MRLSRPSALQADERHGTLRRLGATTAWLLVWTYLYLVVLLSGWVALASLAGGWEPVVVTSGSMEPTIRAGDILLIDEHPEGLLGQQAVVVVERQDDRVAHRVFEVADGRYVTKGDANLVPDPEPVEPEEVVGVGRLVVPAIGLPIVWAQRGETITLVAWAAVTIAAFVVVATSSIRRIRSRRIKLDRPASAVSQTGVRRLRGLVAIMVGLQYLVDGDQFAVDGAGVPRWTVPLLTIALLALVNMATGRETDARARSWSGLTGLAVDTAVVVAMAATVGSSGIAWVLFALPIIEAAIGFGIVGALFHWLILTSVTLVSQIWIGELAGRNTGELIGELEQVLDQLSILFLVVIPGAYLAEQLMIDVRSQKRATEAARDRSQLLETVVEAGHEVNRIGGHHVEALVGAAVDLGFDTADVVVVEPTGVATIMARRSLSGNELPGPGDPASGLTDRDLEHTTVIVDDLDPSPAEVDALARSGFTAVVATLVRKVEGKRVILRVGSTISNRLNADRLDAVRLLASQAGVALTNDQLVGELRGMRDEMTYRAQHDALTGLPNRSGLRPALNSALDDGDATTRPAVLFLDLNGFKPVNDRLGHDAGDQLLCEIAGRLQGLVEDPDFVARLGGDEFVIMLHDGNPEAVQQMIGAVASQFESPFTLAAGNVSVGVAIGSAVATSDVDASELLRRADVAMYEAKRSRMLAVGYEHELDAPRRRRNALAADIDDALVTGQLDLLYQPIVHAATGRVVGIEALVRWDHPRQGPVPPPVLIDAAHDAGLGRQVNAWIVDTALGRASEWGFGRDLNLFVTVNASAEELEYPWVASNVLDAIARHGLPTSAVWVELGEEMVSEPRPVASVNLETLRARGVQLLLDDFGEGQTSLGHLSRLPIGGVKLGREFVRKCLHAEADRIVLESVTDLSTRLGFVVIAEGIETETEYRAVTAAGCQLIQGYHAYRPLTASEVSALLESQKGASGAYGAPDGSVVT